MRSGVPTGLRRHDDVDLERDRSLVERCQQGDARAFEDLYLRYRDRLYRFCLRKLGNSSEAEDAVQEAFARAWRALPNFSGDRRFYPWLSVIAGNLCIDMQRKHSRWTAVDDEDLDHLVPAVSSEQDALSETNGDHDILSRALQRLCDRHREVLELREGRNWTYQQIATHAGVEVSTIETLLFRARKSLRREFMALAQSEGALGSLLIPLFMLRRLVRRSLSGVKASATAAKAAAASLLPSGMASGPAIGGAVAVVASAALVGSSFAIAAGHSSLRPSALTAASATASAAGMSAGVGSVAGSLPGSGVGAGAAGSGFGSRWAMTGTSGGSVSGRGRTSSGLSGHDGLRQLGTRAGESVGGVTGFMGGASAATVGAAKKDVKKVLGGAKKSVKKVLKTVKSVVKNVKKVKKPGGVLGPSGPTGILGPSGPVGGLGFAGGLGLGAGAGAGAGLVRRIGSRKTGRSRAFFPTWTRRA
jgi:RNA polymerase sigma-70 factor (ECF subfamily)